MTSTDTSIRLGVTARDAATNFAGIIVLKTLQLNGNVRYALQPKSEDPSVYKDCIYVDQHMVDYVDEGVAARVPVIALPTLDFNLGDEVRDVISGATGRATEMTWHLNGCLTISVVEPKIIAKDTNVIMIDYARLRKVKAAAPEELTPPLSKPPGGPITRVPRQVAAR